MADRAVVRFADKGEMAKMTVFFAFKPFLFSKLFFLFFAFIRVKHATVPELCYKNFWIEFLLLSTFEVLPRSFPACRWYETRVLDFVLRGRVLLLKFFFPAYMCCFWRMIECRRRLANFSVRNKSFMAVCNFGLYLIFTFSVICWMCHILLHFISALSLCYCCATFRIDDKRSFKMHFLGSLFLALLRGRLPWLSFLINEGMK